MLGHELPCSWDTIGLQKPHTSLVANKIGRLMGSHAQQTRVILMPETNAAVTRVLERYAPRLLRSHIRFCRAGDNPELAVLHVIDEYLGEVDLIASHKAPEQKLGNHGALSAAPPRFDRLCEIVARLDYVDSLHRWGSAQGGPCTAVDRSRRHVQVEFERGHGLLVRPICDHPSHLRRTAARLDEILSAIR